MSPAVSKKQQEMMGADLARAREGKRTRTGMSKPQLEEFASTSRKGLPERKQPEAKPAAEATHRMPGGHMMKDSEMHGNQVMLGSQMRAGGIGDVPQDEVAKKAPAPKRKAFDMVRLGLADYRNKKGGGKEGDRVG